MPFSKKTWVDGVDVANANQLNRIEQGISDATASAVIVCTSTTRPTGAALFDGLHIYQADDKAYGYYNTTLGKWLMFDTIRQNFASVLYTNNAGVYTNVVFGSGAVLDMKYMRRGEVCAIWMRTYTGTTGFSTSDGNFNWTLPFAMSTVDGNLPVIGGGKVSGRGFEFYAAPAMSPGENRFFMFSTFYNGAVADGYRLYPMRNADPGNAPGTSVPRVPSDYFFRDVYPGYMDAWFEYPIVLP